MPTEFPQKTPVDTDSFLKMLDSPLNLQILFYLTVFKNLSLQELSLKLGTSANNNLLEILERLKSLGIVEEIIKDGTTIYRSTSVQYHPLEYEEYKEFSEDQLREYMNEEFLYSYRIISLLKSILGKLIHYICDFYISRIETFPLEADRVKSELKYGSAVPRIGFVTKDEFEIYKRKFLKFESSIIEELRARRKSLGIEDNLEIEYIISSLFIPIKKIIDR